jgi:hypothetical protein
MPLAEYRRRRQTLEQRQNALARQAQQLETQVRDHQALAGVVASVDALCQRVQAGLTQATFEQKRHLVELLIDRVVVTDGDVEIRYVIPTTPASEHVRFCHLRTDYFHLVPLAIHRPVERTAATLVALLRDGVPGAMPAQPGADAPTARAFIGHQAHGPDAWTTTPLPLDTSLLHQRLEHRLVMSLASRYQERHGYAVPVGAHMDLGAEPAAAAA